jgi:nicotinamide mononucleotide adenylyltransferase
MVILVGSAQESGTERNPFNIVTRMDVIKEIYDDPQRIIIRALADLTNENDITSDWGRYVLKATDTVLYKVPEVMIYGNDESRSRWFDPEDIKECMEVIVPRGRIPISATMLREMMILDQRKEWMKYVNPKLHKMYPRLRDELMSVEWYKNRYNELKKNI